MACEPEDPRPMGQDRIQGRRAKTGSKATGPGQDPWPTSQDRILGLRGETGSVANGPRQYPWPKGPRRTHGPQYAPAPRQRIHGRRARERAMADCQKEDPRPEGQTGGSTAEGLDEGPQPNGRTAR